MSEEQNSKALRRWFTIGAVAIVLWAIWLVLRPLRMPIAWAAILAFLLFPLQISLTRRFRGSRTTAAAVLTALDARRHHRAADADRHRVRAAGRSAQRLRCRRIRSCSISPAGSIP